MRVDKFLKNSRLIKRRTVAKEACDGGRVSINGRAAKAGDEVKIGSVIEIRFGASTVRAEVRDLPKVATKENAGEMYRVINDE
ncbi:MAG: RNA-binding S4 domain-containing protein [Oscillospiraceae bacterium]|nr:RNA-binding S4 domain-containing protein [Oscillospiraceae bacterium]